MDLFSNIFLHCDSKNCPLNVYLIPMMWRKSLICIFSIFQKLMLKNGNILFCMLLKPTKLLLTWRYLKILPDDCQQKLAFYIFCMQRIFHGYHCRYWQWQWYQHDGCWRWLKCFHHFPHSTGTLCLYLGSCPWATTWCHGIAPFAFFSPQPYFSKRWIEILFPNVLRPKGMGKGCWWR